MKKLILLGCVLFLSTGCSIDCDYNGNCVNNQDPIEILFGPSDSQPDYTVDVYSELSLDDNGYYHFDYPDGEPHTYSYVKYDVNPSGIVRVFWNSPDEFITEYQGQSFSDPIISYSTYSDDNGSGKQMFYIYEDFIGDTLSIYGHTESDVYDVVQIIIDN